MNATISMTNKLRGTVSMANSKINGGASPYPKGASGSIITITDGAENTPLKSCMVNIEPVQDLHGYSYPWPGGGGVNMAHLADVSRTGNGVTGTVSNEKISASGTATTTYANLNYFNNINIVNGQQYTVMLSKAVNVGITIRFATSTADTTFQQVNVAAGQTKATFTANNNFSVFRLYVSGLTSGATVSFSDLQVLVGSGDVASFSPYSNICPITGWTQVNVWVKPTYDTTLTPTATIPLGRTVYGGTLDVLAGEGESVLGHATYDGTDSSGWTRTAAYGSVTRFDKSISGLKPASGNNLKCNQLKVGTIGTANLVCCNVHGNTPVLQIQIPTSLLASDNVAGLMTYFQSHPLQVCYELATPQEYDVSPQTIKTLLGVNSIWADAGNMEIEYYPAAASIVAVQNRSTKAYVSIPLGMIRYETYQITPQQTIDLDSYRSENGNLLRNPVATKCKIEFNTPLMTDSEWADVWKIIKAGFNNNTERKLKLRYYDTLSATYKTGYFYVPDVQTTIRNIDEGAGVINYNEIRIAFIEY